MLTPGFELALTLCKFDFQEVSRGGVPWRCPVEVYGRGVSWTLKVSLLCDDGSVRTHSAALSTSHVAERPTASLHSHVFAAQKSVLYSDFCR